MNGFYSFLIILFLVIVIIAWKGLKIMNFFYDHFIGLLTTAYFFALIQCTALYIWSFFGKKILAKGGNSTSHVYNFWMGRELNPRIGSFDFKQFNELRPGMILWAVLDIAFLCKSLDDGKLEDSMIIVVLTQIWYIADSVINESAILTTMDITTDGFGYMLSFGDLVWVPFTYTLQARFFIWHPVHLGVFGIIAVIGLMLIGYFIFRGANGQKDEFRNNPDSEKSKKIKFIETQRKTKLMTSGWWGKARHINYLGDWLMAWSWCLPTGFSTPITYFYVGYFAVLLIHRERRDNEKCHLKYGADWEKYCEIVKYRIIPYVY